MEPYTCNECGKVARIATGWVHTQEAFYVVQSTCAGCWRKMKNEEARAVKKAVNKARGHDELRPMEIIRELDI